MAKRTIIGVDLAKNEFAVWATDGGAKPRIKRKVRRGQFLSLLRKQPKSLVAMEACGSAHHWARQVKALGHEYKLLPPQHVKGYQRGQKNDYNDAQAIAEACEHGHIRGTQVKSVEQQDERMLHKLRRSLDKERTRLSNQLRSLLMEYGVFIPKGVGALKRELPLALEDAENELTPRSRELLQRQYRHFLDIEEEWNWYTQQVEQAAKDNEVCRRLEEIPGIGWINGSVLKSWMGDGRQFQRGRDASAALGLVPRQHSTGGKERLYGISKRGDAYVRAMAIHGCRSVVRHAEGKTDPLSRWIQRVKAQRGHNKAVVALANKLVRIAWVIVARDERYRPPQEQAA